MPPFIINSIYILFDFKGFSVGAIVVSDKSEDYSPYVFFMATGTG